MIDQFLQFLTYLEESISLPIKVWELEEVTIGSRSYLVEHQLLKLQLLIPRDLGDYYIQTSKFLLFGVFFSVNFFTPKLMKIGWSSLFWGVFCTSLPYEIEHTCFKFQLQICRYEWARIIFVDGGLDSTLQYYGPCKNSFKK